MRVGIDCRTILNPKSSERAGVAHYSYYLVKHILANDKNNEYTLFLSHDQPLPQEFLAHNVRVIYFSKKILPFIHSHFSIALEIKKQHLDVFHSLSGILPLLYRGRSIITIADLAMYVNPQWFLPKKLIGDFFWRKVLIPKSIKKADTIIAVSEHTKKDIVRFFNIDEKKIIVIYNGFELENISDKKIDEVLGKFDLMGKKYCLFIGTIEPRKNIINIIKAFEGISEEYFLVIAGGLGWKYGPILDAIENSKAKKRIHYIGYVGGEEKIALMRRAICFVWPSLYEGFGLPILEAMACNAPVVTSNTSSIPEVAGNAAIMVDPNNATEISSALKKVVEDEDEQKKLRQLGAQRIKNFSWEKTSQKTIEAYLSLGSQKIH